LAADVDRLLAAGASAAAGHDGLSRRGRALRELGQKVAALKPVADAVERVTGASSREAGRAFLDLVVMTRQLRGSLAGAGAEGDLRPAEASGPWQTPTPTRDVYAAHEALSGETSAAALYDAAQRQVAGDLRLVPSALAAVESGNTEMANTVADKVLPAVGRGVLPDLLARFDFKGKSADARRLRAVCKIDPQVGAELVRKGLTEGSPPLKIQALECLPDVGQPGEAEKAGLEMWREKKKDVRVAALRALRKATGDEALEVLMQALLDSDGQVIGTAQEVLAELPHPRATERLLCEVERLLAALPPPLPKPKKGAKKEAVKAAEEAQQEREAAVTTLHRVILALGGRKAIGNPRVLKLLLELAHAAEDQIRLATVWALGNLGPDVPEVIPALAEAIRNATYESPAALHTLAQFPAEKREAVIPTLIERAKDPKFDQHLVYSIVCMLPQHMQRYGGKILDLLRQLLKGNNKDVHNYAIQALGEIGPPAQKLLPEIVEWLQSGTGQGYYANVFSNIEPEGTTLIPALIELLGDRKSRLLALSGLVGYGPKAQAAEPLVTKLVNDRDWQVKQWAELTLNAIKGQG
jgi:HEAT repeat protein